MKAPTEPPKPRGGSAGRPPSRGASEFKKLVGLRLRLVREVIYDSTSEAARVVGVPDGTWRNWEKGVRYPDPAQLVAFIDRHGLTADWIYRGRLGGIHEDVQIRLVARLAREYPDLLDTNTAWGAAPLSTGAAQTPRRG